MKSRAVSLIRRRRKKSDYISAGSRGAFKPFKANEIFLIAEGDSGKIIGVILRSRFFNRLNAKYRISIVIGDIFLCQL